jgi:prophage regulatory protein
MSLDRVIRKKELLPFIGLSDVTIWRMERAGKFPRRIRLGGNSVGWYESEIIEWQERKKAERAG